MKIESEDYPLFRLVEPRHSPQYYAEKFYALWNDSRQRACSYLIQNPFAIVDLNSADIMAIAGYADRYESKQTIDALYEAIDRNLPRIVRRELVSSCAGLQNLIDESEGNESRAG